MIAQFAIFKAVFDDNGTNIAKSDIIIQNTCSSWYSVAEID